MITYFSQAFSGPLFLISPLLTYILRYGFRGRVTGIPGFFWRLSYVLAKLLPPFAESNFFTCVAILIAGFIRNSQTPGIMELHFLSKLVVFEMNILNLVVLNTGLQFQLNQTLYKLPWIVVPWYLANGLLFVGFFLVSRYIGVISLSRNVIDLYNKASLACQEFWGYPDPNKPSPYEVVTLSEWKFWAIVLGTCCTFFIPRFLFYRVNDRIYSRWGWSFGRWPKRILPLWVKKHGHAILTITNMCLALSGVFGMPMMLEYYRLQGRLAIGASFQDDDWGFGQVTAVFLMWAPLFKELLSNIWCKIIY
jgi:hypothetical protein